MNIATRKFAALKSAPPVSKTTPTPWLLWNSARMIANTNSPSSSNSTPVLLMIATTRTPKMFSSVMTTQRDDRDPLLVGQAVGRHVAEADVVDAPGSASAAASPRRPRRSARPPTGRSSPRTTRTAWSGSAASSTGTPSPRSGSGEETSAKFSATMNWPSATTGNVQMNAPPSVPTPRMNSVKMPVAGEM